MTLSEQFLTETESVKFKQSAFSLDLMKDNTEESHRLSQLFYADFKELTLILFAGRSLDPVNPEKSDLQRLHFFMCRGQTT